MLKTILKIVLILIIILCLFLLFYKPLGKLFIETKDYDLEYYQDGKFISTSSPMTSTKSEFDGTNKKPSKDIPIHKMDKIPDIKDTIQYTWLGHSSGLLQISNMNILIDPIMSDYASPVQALFVKRFSDVPLEINDIDEIDIVVISHDHYDHLDYHTIKQLDSKVKQYIVPLNVEQHLLRWNIDQDKIKVVKWYDKIMINDLKIIATPGIHFTGRIPTNSNKTLWCGYIFDDNTYKVYYTGDTGYGNHYKDIYDRYGNIDLVLLENGQYDKRWNEIHMHPSDGIQAIKDLHAKYFIPIHSSAFCICNHPWDHPLKTITTLSKEKQLNCITPMIGETVYYKDIDTYTNIWWE